MAEYTFIILVPKILINIRKGEYLGSMKIYIEIMIKYMTLWKKISSMEVKCICTLRPSNISLMCVWHVYFFNWRMIALQYFVSFCHTPMWTSHRCVYVSSLLNLPPTAHLIKKKRLPALKFLLCYIHLNFLYLL